MRLPAPSHGCRNINYQSKVRAAPSERAANVPSRLIGKEVSDPLTPTGRKCTQGHRVERMERVREANVNYRHVIGSLVLSQLPLPLPGAAVSHHDFRLTYDALRVGAMPVEYVRILHGSTTMEATVDSEAVVAAGGRT